MDGPVRHPPWIQHLVWTVAVLSLTVLAAAAVVRSTVLDPGFHGRVLDEERAYQRVYDEVLVDPQLTPTLRDLLGLLPVPQSTVTSNIKVVIPPETLRAMGDRQITEVVHYLEGDRARLRLMVDLGPLVANIERLSQVYFADAVASLQQRSEPDFEVFTARLSDVAARVVAGDAPAGALPSLALSQDQAIAATTVLLHLVPEAERSGLRSEVEAALVSGDVASALAAVAPVAVSERVQAAAAELLRDAGGRTWVITTDLAPSGDVPAQAHRARSVTRLFQEVVEPAAAVLGAAALILLWSVSPRPTPRRLIPLGWALAAAATLTALAVLVIRVTVGDSPYRPPSSWPPTAARLFEDIQATAVDRLLTTATVVALILLAAGALLVSLGWAWQTRPTVRIRIEPRQRLVLTAVVSASALVGTMLAPVAMTGPAPRVCQGSSRLCDVRYDEIAQLAAHNAMATTADRFIGPLQDPDIVGQLNIGVRALLIDTHRWERPEQVANRLATSDFSPKLRRQLTRALARVNPHRPGLWLCHSVCGAGALELAPALRQIGDWLRTHPTEVVTLIVQDGITPRETRSAFEQAGLADLLYKPGEDPHHAWPTMKDMIDSGRRLVVFAEKADGPAPWYRNFYRYGMETPFAFRSPAEMTCTPHRGGTGKRLFLLNHFITADGGRRLDAGTINSREYVLNRAHACERQRGRPVNFVAVDYATIGDARAAVDALNTERLQDDDATATR
ncbi:PI-PLC domain-containing protein [Streptomyces sp. TRM70350]|uniref:PI-PLC domain-containing protein n=1 Tax=Streptomyces sp. TRM70350 TaxID=2856165 RepID=UPI001C469DBA|nr:PI-PLC domain-containing protein [Streptomyces sp. TRM70350]MBV7700494.1 PI-PLC domain-containing protein [Streptomyces sp. TRM70350]